MKQGRFSLKAALIAVILRDEGSYNKAEERLFLSIMADEARIRQGEEILSQEKFVKVLPEGVKEVGTSSFSDPEIRIKEADRLWRLAGGLSVFLVR